MIYCEGLCRNNGTKFAKAGYAIVFGLQDPRNVSMRVEGAQSTQRADLSAISHLVTLLLRDNTPSSTSAVSVATHSKWLVSTVNENLDNWKRAGWTNQAREKVENLDLLLQLDKLLAQLSQQGKSVHMEFVRMQEASPAHVLADKLANAGCDLQQSPVLASQLSPPQSPQEQRRRRSSTGFPPQQQQSPGGGHHQNQYGGYPGAGFYGNGQPQQQHYSNGHHPQQQYQQGNPQPQGYPSPQWQQQQYQQQQYQQEWR